MKKLLSILMLLVAIVTGASADVVWQSDMQETIEGVTQTKGRANDSWSTSLNLKYAPGYTKGFQCGGSSSTLTLAFDEALSLTTGNTIRIYAGSGSNSRTLKLYLNGASTEVKTQSFDEKSFRVLEYELPSNVDLASIKLAASNSGVYIFKVEIIGEKPSTGTTTLSYFFTYKSANVQGITNNGISTISGFPNVLTVSTVAIGTNNGQEGCTGQITGQAASQSDNSYVDMQFTVADGYTFTPSAVSFGWKSNGSDLKAKVAIMDTETTVISNESASQGSTDKVDNITFANDAFTGKSFTGTVHIRVYTYGTTSKRAYLVTPFTITGTVASAAPAVPTLTGAWKIGEDDVTGNTAVAVQGSTPAPTMPAFTVGATDGTPTESDYEVEYSETGTSGIFTYTDGVPTGISTTNAGSATITATLTTKDNTKYLTPETNTFTYTVSISAASAPQINVSGAPENAVKVGTEVILTATATGVPTPTITWYNGSDEPVATVEGTVLAYPVPTTTAGTYTFYAVASNGVEPNAISAVQTVVVKEQVATPTFTPNGGYFQESQSVTIACDGADAIVYSTDNGETWTSYTEALNITETTTVLAKATKEGYIASETASATFTKLDAQTTVSTAKTWDWDTFTTDQVKMTEEKGHDIIMSNVPKYGYTIAFPEGFDAQAILFNGEYPVRTQGSNKVGGAVYLKINTTVAGTLTVTYADNGNNNRYLRVTDSTDTPQDGPTSSSTTDYKTFTCAVAAGEVKLAGYDGTKDTYIRFNKIVFTPFAAQDITVGETGFATVGLPFASTVPEGVTAYAVESVAGSKVKMSAAIEAGTTIPANKGFVIVAAKGNYSFAPVASSSYEGTDILEATGINEKAATTEDPIYVLTITDATNKKVGFKKATSGSLGAYKAYLPGTVATGNSLTMDFDDATAINGVAEANEADAEAPVKVIKNGKLFIGNYNVAGQLVK